MTVTLSFMEIISVVAMLLADAFTNKTTIGKLYIDGKNSIK